jgi:arylsulfatase A-like enzyme
MLMRNCLAVLLLFLVGSFPHAFAATPRPNIVVILADDLGYGDVQAFNPQGKIRTPHLDQLAAQGVRFTDAHSPSAVCSPTRYGLITGRYAWRSKLQQGVLGGLSPRLIEPGRMTIASLLKANGYHTACVGKWHLGMDWVRKAGKSVNELGIESPAQVHNVEYDQPIANGPNSVGFDFYYGISASLDMVPYTYIQNNQVVANPTEDKRFLMVHGREMKGFTRLGPGAPDFEATNVLPDLTKQAVQYLESRADAARKGNPFFLYLPFASPHTPTAPREDWVGKSGLNAYADFVMQTDAAAGKVLKKLEELKLAENTLVIFTSDNGCSPFADLPELRAQGHDPCAGWRGHKADIYEGGHRVPFIARWPGKIPANSTSTALATHTDVLATAAEILGIDLPENAGEDSLSLLPAMMGKPGRRKDLISHSVNGSFAIREGNWKLALCPGSGGWSKPRPGQDDTSSEPLVQLFDLSQDPAETTNLQDQKPDLVDRLTKALESQASQGRSTAGAPQNNAVAVDVWRAGKQAHQPLRKKR